MNSHLQRLEEGFVIRPFPLPILPLVWRELWQRQLATFHPLCHPTFLSHLRDRGRRWLACGPTAGQLKGQGESSGQGQR